MKIYLDNNLGVTNVEQEELTQDTIGYNILKVYIPNAVLTPYDTFTCYYGALLQNGRKVGWFAMEARTSTDADYEENYTLYKATLEQCVVSVEGKVYIGCQVLLGNSGNATLIKKNTAVVQFNVRKSVAINNDILVLDPDQTNTDVLESYKQLLENALLTYATKATTYTKTEVDGKLDLKADKSNVYTKDEVDTKDLNLAGQIASAKLELNNKINATNTQLGITNDKVTTLENDVENLKSVQNVVDIVPTYSALQSYDTSKLGIDDKVQVIADETHDGASTIYNWDGTQWQYVGAYGTNSYTKQESDNKFALKSTAVSHDGNQLKDSEGNNIYPNLDAKTQAKIDNAYGPAYVGKDTSTNILAKTSNQGIWIGSDTGHWYYWNGTHYVDGGVYQATEIADEKVNFNKLSNNVKINENITNYFDENNLIDGVVNGSNVITGNSWKHTDYINAKYGDIVYFASSNGNDNTCIQIYDENHNYIKQYFYPTKKVEGYITIDDLRCKYLIYNVVPNQTAWLLYTNQYLYINPNFIFDVNYFLNGTDTNKITKVTLTPNTFINENGTVTSNQYSKGRLLTDYIKVNKGDIIKMAYGVGKDMNFGSYFDEDKNYIAPLWGSKTNAKPTVNINGAVEVISPYDGYIRYNIVNNSVFNYSNQYLIIMSNITYSDIISKLEYKTNVNNDKKRVPTVVFISDDGRDTDYSILKPLSETYNVPFCSAIITNKINHTDYMTDTQLKELQNDYGWEMASHTHDHYVLSNLSENDQRHQLLTSKNKLLDLGLNVTTIVYPQGGNNEITRRVAREMYHYGVRVEDYNIKVNMGIIPMFYIARTNLGSYFEQQNPRYSMATNTYEYYKQHVDDAIANNGLVVFELHTWREEFDETQQGYLEQIIQYALANNVTITTISKAMEIFGNAIESGDYLGNNRGDTRSVAISKNGLCDIHIPKPATINNSTLISAFPKGLHSYEIPTSASAGFPTGAGTLVVYNSETQSSYVYSKQLWCPFNQDTIYMRRFADDGTPYNWKKITFESI